MRIGLHSDGLYLSGLCYFIVKEVAKIFKLVIIVGSICKWGALRYGAGRPRRRRKQAKGEITY